MDKGNGLDVRAGRVGGGGIFIFIAAPTQFQHVTRWEDDRESDKGAKESERANMMAPAEGRQHQQLTQHQESQSKFD